MGKQNGRPKGSRVSKGASPLVCRGDLPTSSSAARQCHRKQISVKTKKWFKSSPRCHRLWLIDPSMPSLRFRKDTQGMECWKMSLLVQLRMGHVQLQAHLKRIGKMDSPICPRCHKAEETVGHYLTECVAFATQRGCMERQLWRAAKSVSVTSECTALLSRESGSGGYWTAASARALRQPTSCGS